MALFVVLCAALVLPPQQAGAQSTSNPFCYTEVGGHAVEENCQNWTSIIRNGTGSAPQQGQCYGLGFGVVAVAYTSQECVAARGEASSPLPDARCYRYDGNISAYNGASYDTNALSEVSCSDIRSNFGYDFTPGNCYVVGEGSRTSSSPCTQHDALFQAAYATQRSSVSTDCNEDNLDSSNCQIINRLVQGINLLSAVVGVVVVMMIVWAGIKYTMSKDDPQQTAAAKEHIKNAIIALLVYLFMFGFLQWVVPGGIFR